MRVNMGREGRTSSSLSANGGSMLGALILANGPSQPLEAATKYYVDSTFASLNANNVLDGVLPISSLPGFTGDATSPQGSNVITLTDLGVAPGSYAKVIVDAKGRVTGNDILTESDIPIVSWDKVQNKPNTLEGYGITDGLSITGGVFNGQMSVVTPTNSLSSVSKQYVDAALSGNSAVVGDIIRKPFASTPTGFLRCNGGLVDKTTYADLYAVIGDNFSINTVPGSGRPWEQQYDINTLQTGNITNWTAYGSLPYGVLYHKCVVTKHRVYVIGGGNSGARFSSVYTAPIQSDGAIGVWSAAGSLPGEFAYFTAFVTKNYLYLIGGGTNTVSTLNTVYMAAINSDGTLGAWTSSGNYPIAVNSVQVVVLKDRVYVLGGGTSSGVTDAIYKATINSDGTLGAWTLYGTMPIAINAGMLAVTKNRIHYIGGSTQSVAALNTIYSAAINTDGTLGSWSLSGTLPVGLVVGCIFVTKNCVYLLGGAYAINSYTANTYRANINLDGTLTGWEYMGTMPYTLGYSTCVVVKNKVHVIGGYLNSGVSSTVMTAQINSVTQDYSPYYNPIEINYVMPGSGQPWQQQYQSNTSQSSDITNWNTTTTLPAIQGNSTALVTKNRVYLIGGKDNSGYLNTVSSATINSDGTLGAWSASGTFPIAISDAQLITTKAHVYLIGGRNSSGYLNTIYSATINADGTLGSWVKQSEYVTQILSGSGTLTVPVGTTNITIHGKGSDGSTTTPYWGNPVMYYNGTPYTSTVPSTISDSLPSQLTFTDVNSNQNTIYLDSSTATTVTYYSALGYQAIYQRVSNSTNGTNTSIVVDGVTYTSNGGVGTAATQTTNNLTFSGASSIPVSYNIASGGSGDISYSFGNYTPYAVSGAKIFVTKNTVYLVGGYVNGAYSSTVYSAPIDSNGVIGAWSTGTSLPGVLAFSSLAVTRNRVYLIGGTTNGSNSVSTVYTAPINVNGTLGTWTTTTSLPTAVCKASVFVTSNKIYVIGGNVSNNTASSIVQIAPINSDGTLGTWTSGTSLPGVFSESSLITTKDHIYLLNGNTGATYVNTNYMASITEGINDYISYYDGTIVAYENSNESNLFSLPDFSSKEKNGINLYIKY